MIKLCIWMNIPSHHQSAFFKAISSRNNVDLVVRFYEKVPVERINLGWNSEEALPANQEYIANIKTLKTSVPDFRKRIHIIPGFSSPFLKDLIHIVIRENIKWIHWSERSGVKLAILLHFNYRFISLLNPLFLYIKGYKKYARNINKNAVGAFAIGELAKNDFIKWGVAKEKIEFLPYSLAGLTSIKEQAITLKKSDELLFMYVGSLYELKGIKILLSAFAQLTDKSKKCRLVLIGQDRSEGKYFEQTKDLEIANQVEFLGIIESAKINEYLSQADVFILPTLFDGWGAVLNEAASLGKPLISTNQAGASFHLIKNNENGFMVEAGSIAALTQAMQFYIDNPETITTHGKKSLELFEKITPEKSVDLFLSNINKFLGKNQ